MALAFGHLAFKYGRSAFDTIQLLYGGAELRVGEPGADAGDIDQSIAVEGGDVERAGADASALGRAVTHYDEVAGALQAHFEPIGRAAAAIGRVGALGDDAFEPELAHFFEHLEPALFDVIGIVQWTQSRQ